MSTITRPSILDAFPLTALVDHLLTQQHAEWSVEPRRPWCYVTPADKQIPDQGWKLHVSATPLSAPIVLVAAAQVLLDRGCRFKFAADLNVVRQMDSARASRGGSGKFITAYPRNEEEFRLLAELLHDATRGLPGPAILSDRRYKPGSIVYYRYGAFVGITALGNDGAYEAMITAPDGSLVRDRRMAWFTPPSWAPNPFPDSDDAVRTRAKPSAVLLNDRYEVRRALQHANKGGVYHAEDRCTGALAVIKQARPHTQSSIRGTDGRDVLRHEARMLERLAGSQVAPRLIEVFEQGGDLFLAEELVPGEVLRASVMAHVWRQGAVPLPAVRELGTRLVDLVAKVHELGLVIRDFSPNNVMVTPTGELRLIDLEYLAEADSDLMVPRVFTAGYAAPEVQGADAYCPVPAQTADLYALGASLFYIATGSDPVLPLGAFAAFGSPKTPRPDEARDLFAGLLAAMRADVPGLHAFGALIAALTSTDPADRPGLAEVAAALRGDGRGHATDRTAPAPASATPVELDATIDRTLRQLLSRIDPTAERELSRSGEFGATADRLAVQHGAAGCLAVLVQAARARADAVDPLTVAAVARWIVNALPREPRLLPGLYFGRSGVAWALADAAELLDDTDLARAADELSDRIPLRWPNPDVCHGAAGAGLAQLRRWRSSGDPLALERVRRCADALASAAEQHDGTVWWPVPSDFDSGFAGTAYLGFGHGTAGVATFLLAAARATGEERYLDLARAAGRTLAGTAVHDGDAAWWPAERSPKPPARRALSAHWCTGASGIGTFLIRLWAATGDDQFRDLAAAAARTAWRSRWLAAPVQCHGSAGDAELFLDLAALTGDAQYRQRAQTMAEVMLARALRDEEGELVFPDETNNNVVADFQTGLSGTLSFFLRLRDGGPRLWLDAAGDWSAAAAELDSTAPAVVR